MYLGRVPEVYAPVSKSTSCGAWRSRAESFSRGTTRLTRRVFKLGERVAKSSRAVKLTLEFMQEMSRDSNEVIVAGKWLSQWPVKSITLLSRKSNSLNFLHCNIKDRS